MFDLHLASIDLPLAMRKKTRANFKGMVGRVIDDVVTPSESRSKRKLLNKEDIGTYQEFVDDESGEDQQSDVTRSVHRFENK